ncbi:penicillin-binding transpeptidase domain-containing protein [Halalkalibacter krulwichiae]|uniref:serine-type D-Ala-D-Ala carboxypeptidase n=1 Tax=Halalkalibacter krulwichiae TaxID=199441 RepID=A0A1X9MCA6_9BACI|nr:penicillin-binding transpeptidase domain-containing protein [Halalkalibacter krulwichiae]ARK31099.1 Penicillin-binding protein 2B [Halalkalibacter krulwichiae]
MEIKRSVTNKRALLLLILFLLLFSVLLGRIVYIQAKKEIDGQNLEALAKERWTRSETIKGVRGTIYDRAGDALAQELKSYTFYAVLDPNQRSFVKNIDETASLLAPLIDMDENQLRQALARGQSDEKFQIELGAGARNLTHEQAREIIELGLDGIEYRDEPRRYYPKQTYASHVIGYTERDMGEARMGIERSLDEYLQAEDGSLHYQSDRRGIPLPDPNQNITPAKNGHDVYLTLDSNIQTALEQVMSQVEADYDPEKIIAIVADPKTGEILAMSNRPSFNPNQYEQITNYLNYAITDRFEPGSTVKTFTVAAAIEEGVYKGDETFPSGSIQIADRTIRDHNQARGWGTITYDEGFLRSSNVAMSKIALEKLGPEKLYQYLEKFGFYNKTGIDLPNESDSLIANNGPVDAATTAFGQGTAVTPIQQIQAATAIANDGKMMKPYIIDRIIDPDTNETILDNEPEQIGEPVSKETAEQVRDLLGQVVSSSAGTGNLYNIEGFDVAGKTGTAQIRDPNAAGYIYGHGENIFSFLGMAPKDDPQLIVYVAVERPKISQMETGSVPTSQIFNTIMKHSLQYLSIAPTESENNEQSTNGFVTDNYQGQTIKKVIETVEVSGVDIVVLGDGKKVEAQQPLDERGMLVGERLFLRTDGDEYQMPDMTGWSNRDVRRFAQVLDMNPTFFGNGYVLTQSIEPGVTIKKGEYLVVELGGLNELEELDEVEEGAEETMEDTTE